MKKLIESLLKLKLPIIFIPFKILDKYKYFYFAISSLIMAIGVVLLLELVNKGDFILKHLVREFFHFWGFMYPASFAAYEVAKKHNDEDTGKR
ncbi:MAG: hypothetical protein FWC37_06400 [Lentimicrobiaceae bacterium]|nr:hypothetical protein [Lentimicrobiaceae bacterium]